MHNCSVKNILKMRKHMPNKFRKIVNVACKAIGLIEVTLKMNIFNDAESKIFNSFFPDAKFRMLF